MLIIKELKKKIKKLQNEKTQLNDKIMKLKLEADGKALKMEKEIFGLREEIESIRELIPPR